VEQKVRDEKISFSQAARCVNVPVSLVYRWRANASLPDLSDDSSPFAGKAKNHQGPEEESF